MLLSIPTRMAQRLSRTLVQSPLTVVGLDLDQMKFAFIRVILGEFLFLGAIRLPR